ncbi:hypothetical protein AAFX91_21040 [Bradyrhizobium sp. 31Argb]|uniref:hypothetical protein n=1 Tax=unclassified Bradyrhizobium TaxID=2631580 RepID=UPI00102EC693|nr:hypothetical protein [Bradyrhizobium sp. Leo170]TAI60271.1 hypothetical protein CWO89_41610 [Bradyrhizobium sp. Leo170]
MRSIILATAVVALAAASGQAFARSGASIPRQETAVDQRAYDAFNAFDQQVAPQMSDADAHRYHGGPKSND